MSKKIVSETFYAIESKTNRGKFMTVDIDENTVDDPDSMIAITASTPDRLFHLMEEYRERIEKLPQKYEVVKVKKSVTVNTHVYDAQEEEKAWNEKRKETAANIDKVRKSMSKR